MPSMAAGSCGCSIQGDRTAIVRAHHDEYGFQPIVVFDGEGCFVTAVLRPAKRPEGTEIRAFLRRLPRAIRANWPKTAITLRAGSHYCRPEVLDWRRSNQIGTIPGVAPATTLRAHVPALEADAKARFAAAPEQGNPRTLHEEGHCRCGQAENHIKS